MPERLEKNEEESELFSLDITNEEVIEEAKPKQKEYEKLLFQDESRLKAVKALKLVKLGLFDQYQKKPEEVNFNELKKLDYAKKYKNHELYERVADGAFFYIQTLDEEAKNGYKKIYAYDIVEVDNVDEATYAKILSAHKHEGNVALNIVYTLAWIFTVMGFVSLVYSTIYYSINNHANYFVTLFYTLGNVVTLFAISVSVLVIAIIAKKNHDNK